MKKGEEYDDRAIPDIRQFLVLHPNENSLEIGLEFFEFMYQIKHSGLEDGLINLHDSFKNFYQRYWQEYERSKEQCRIADKLKEVMKENFTTDEMMMIGQMQDFTLTDNIPEEEEIIGSAWNPKGQSTFNVKKV